MELSEVVNKDYAFPIGVVLICAVLVFAFGFKSAEQPAFAQLTYTGDDRKPAGKKRKIKDKKTQSNGHITAVSDENVDVKHKTNEAPSSKSNANKVTLKQVKEGKHESEKSPAKDVPSKTATKQQKQNKQETSPIKEQQKSGAKESSSKSVNTKVQKEKEIKKEVVEPVSKQMKEKKQEASDKSPSKDSNKNVSSKQSKGKGKENQVEDLKNKKNEKNLAKLKGEEKPTDFDDGEWEQALSRKDKKNRKKDDPSDETILENIVKKESSPAKKKKAKNVDAVINNDNINSDEKKIIEETTSKTPEKKADKEKKMIEEKEDIPVVEVAVSPEVKSNEESANVDAAARSKKKNKKKSGSKPTEPEAPATIETIETQDDTHSTPVVEIKITENKLKEEVKPKIMEPMTKNDAENSVAFDELGDVWKEAKAPKKSKKKVRKDQ
ncbi:hypothetical protein L9F63_004087 [Diploptera punctata]|uniref:Triadin n=1 Tax=Diploptera punctata TaxID=6984 RepID=A0AAD8E852_DIPPU|nr:hypothetical protein L9F63_004087 [Diploptera punctata]